MIIISVGLHLFDDIKTNLYKATPCRGTHLSWHLLTGGLWSVFLDLSWGHITLLNWPVVTLLLLKESWNY